MTSRAPEEGTPLEPNDNARTSESISLTTEPHAPQPTRRSSVEPPSAPAHLKAHVVITVSGTARVTMNAPASNRPTAPVTAQLPPLRVKRLSVEEAREAARQTAEVAETARQVQLEEEAGQGIDWNEVE